MLRGHQARPAVGDSAARSCDHDGLSVVIVTYQSAAVIGQCLSALGQAAPDIPMEVIIVDNASADDTVKVARAAAPSARIIEPGHNGGFAAGCAVGAGAASGSWLLFLNPDTVIAAEAIKALLGCADDHRSAGIIGGRFVDEDGKADLSSWWGRPTLWSAACFALGLSTLMAGNSLFDPEAARPWSSDLSQVRVVPIVSGALMLVKRELWDELGGFDPSFFMYGEDADFCLRAARAGCRPMVTAAAVCHHAGGKSSSGAQKLLLLFTGKCTLIHRHFPRGLRHGGVFLLLSGVLVRATLGKRIGVSPDGPKRPRTDGGNWQALWAKRREWQQGWTHSAH